MGKSTRSVVFSFVLFAAALFVVASWNAPLPADTRATVAAAPVCAALSPTLSLQAKAAFAADVTSRKILYEKNADAQLPLASLTKLATVATAFDYLSPDDTIILTQEALKPEADMGDLSLRVGEKWQAQMLADYTLMVSANRGAHALALAAAQKQGTDDAGFISEMNEKAQKLGMHETFFASDTGLDVSSTTAGAYGSARDIATLISSIADANPRLLEGTTAENGTFTSLSGITHAGSNTSSVISALTGAVASKTGYTDLAGGNLAVVFEPLPGRPVVAVVLGSTRDGRDTDMETLAAAAKTALKRMLLCENGSESP